MLRTIVNAVLLVLFELWFRWRDRKAVEKASEAQKANDARERGSAGDIAERLRERAKREGL
jgi:uncharacterized membrane protein